MNVWVYPIGLIALILAWGLRKPVSTHPYRAFLLMLIGVVISAAGVRFVSEQARISRPTDFDYFIVDSLRLLEAEPDAPYIVFSGASFSRNGLDDQRLTEQLRKMGYPHRVINLSLQGSSLQERHAALRRFLEEVDRPADRVFLSVAPEFDQRAAYVFQAANKFSERAIKQMDFESASWAGLGLIGGACPGLSDCVKDVAMTPIHLLMNASNLGLLSGGQDLIRLDPLKVFDAKGEDEVHPGFEQTDEEIADGIARRTAPEASDGPHWAASFRSQQRVDLRDLGVEAISYYLPPVVSPEIRTYIGSLCLGELADFACIAPLDPELLDPLNQQVWFDPKHLQQSGAAHYTDWMAQQIDERGLLE